MAARALNLGSLSGAPAKIMMIFERVALDRRLRRAATRLKYAGSPLLDTEYTENHGISSITSLR